MDGLFAGPPGERRRFLDRLVLAVDAGHGARVNALDRALRNRNRLLEETGADRRWLDAAEHEVADLAVAVAASRADTVRRLAALIEEEADPTSLFPFARLALDGAVENAVLEEPALAVEERYREVLRAARARATVLLAARSRAPISPILPSSMARRASPPPMPRPASRRRCCSASCSPMRDSSPASPA